MKHPGKSRNGATPASALVSLLLVLAMAVSLAGLASGPVAKCCVQEARSTNIAHCCCGNGMACCKVKEPVKPAPLAFSSHQALFKAMPSVVRGLVLYRISLVQYPVRISRGEFPPPPLAPLAQGCIQLI